MCSSSQLRELTHTPLVHTPLVHTVPQPPADFGITLSEEERAPTSYLVRLDLERTNVANVMIDFVALISRR